jgi:hypothetical protein
MILNNALLSVRIKFDSPVVGELRLFLINVIRPGCSARPLRSDDTRNRSQG